MAPRPGGETDKLGNKYELAWAIRHALYCVQDGRRALTLEDIDPDLGKGSEFTYELDSGLEVHQLKRQNGNSNSWTIRALADLGIFKAAAQQVAAGRTYHFVSLVPCRPLQEMADRARRAADLTAFTQSWLTTELEPFFTQLSAATVLGSAQQAFTTLRGTRFSVQDEHDIIRMNSMLADCTLSGATGHLAAIAIGDILLSNLGRRLTQTELLREFQTYGIEPLAVGSRQSARDELAHVTQSWLDSVQRDLLSPAIVRSEASELTQLLVDERLGLVVGTAGGGKSSVLEQTVTALQSTGAEVLAFRLDRLDSFASTVDLGRRLGLDTSPAAALALAAQGRSAYLVVDQLDAVSLASGRMPESFDVVRDLIREALSVGGIRVVLACREFDVENDYRIRDLAAQPHVKQLRVDLLTEDAVKSAVMAMALDADQLSPSQLLILRTPLHLVLLSSIAKQQAALAFQSKGSLFESFWERKRQAAMRKRASVRFNDVLARVANAVSDRQVLSVPVEILDEGDLIEDANVLVSEHVLARDGDRIAFYHETFFDYAFARQWVSRSETLVEFLRRDEQELFRRGQVRQILQHLHDRDAERFLEELEGLLMSADVRFHIKETAIAVLANLAEPTTDEAALAVRLTAAKPSFEGRLWQELRRPQWFKRFADEGLIASWLDGTELDAQQKAVNLLVSGASSHGDDVAGLLETRRQSAGYFDWLRWIVRFAGLPSNRRLFEMFLEAVATGAFDAAEHDLWLSVHELAKQQPAWAIELLRARLIEHDDPLTLDSEGKVAALTVREYGAAELVRDAAAAEPALFIETILPYLREVIAATAYSEHEGRPIRDRHFSLRFPEDEDPERELDDALFRAVTQALEALARTTATSIKPILEELAGDPYDSSQYLLYRALIAGGAPFSDWAAALLLEGGTRLTCGYISDGDWVARELLRTTAPNVSDEVHQQLENSVRDLRNPYEDRHTTGRTAFSFLSALDESRLSPEGWRRLGEYRRKFNSDEPPAPQGITGGFVGSPVPISAADKMTDDQWLRAMARYAKDEHDWRTLKGGARELSHMLKDRVAAEPTRFAQLALRMTADLNPAYGDAILMGFGEAQADFDLQLLEAAIHHIASFKHPDNDRWLGMALRHHFRDASLDVTRLLIDRAVHSANPADNRPIFVRQRDNGRRAQDLRMSGINTARGSLAETLGDLLIYDVDGTRTALVQPHLSALASDPVLSVRSCVAHTLAAALRHARPDVLTAFTQLIDTDDVLLAVDLVERLMLYIGNVDPDVIAPVIQRMLNSEDAEAREAGGHLAAFAALEWDRPALMAQVLAADGPARKGAARLCARRVDGTLNHALATSTLQRFMNDEDDEVRKAAAEVAAHLRDRALRPYAGLLEALIDSSAYVHATPQLLLTLQHAPDRVDDLVLKASQRFAAVLGKEAADIRTGAAGDAHYISDLVVRGLAQSRDRRHRAALLDVLDLLLQLGVYGIADSIAKAERV